MRRHWHLHAVVTFALTIPGFCSAGHPGEPPAEILARLRQWPDERLRQCLDELLSRSDFRRQTEYEACLTEIVRRGGNQWASILRERLDALNERRFDLYGDPTDVAPGSYFNLELLTALRRVQKQPDPLRIDIELANQEIRATPLSLPMLYVHIRNVDVEKQDVGFAFGGDYRSGRQARWRLSVVDAEGRTVPRRAQGGILTGGGLYQTGVLSHGESWETAIDARRFIAAPLPGRYTLQVLYHNTRTIADQKDLSGLIVCESAELPLVVDPTVIELAEAERRAAAKWIAEINAREKLKVVAGTYGEWAYDFLPPESPQGKLLDMGLKSAPSLIDALRDDALRPEKRAWILSLLFSITGEHDPRAGSILGTYEYLEGPWEVWSGKPGESSDGFASPARGRSLGGTIPEAQRKLSGKWVEWLQTVRVITTPGD